MTLRTVTGIGLMLWMGSACQGTSAAPQELFIGHSFFRPFADNMGPLTEAAELEPRDQEVVFSGGASGSPQALWEDKTYRREIQGYLDGGNVDLFVMTYEPQYPSIDGYISWFDDALENNPDTRFVLALPWPDYPETNYTSATAYSESWQLGHDKDWSQLVQTLEATYPDNEITCIPYGQSALRLRSLFEDGALPDVDVLTSNAEDTDPDNDVGVFVDDKGHPDDILINLGSLVWGRVIYDIEPSTSFLPTTYTTDLVSIANEIVDEHTPH